MNLKRVYNCANKCYLCHISRVEKIFYRQVFFFVDFEDFEIFKIITLLRRLEEKFSRKSFAEVWNVKLASFNRPVRDRMI